ncbi:phage uncharacterized protein, XkdX family [Thermoclostridium stercorarium subsp. stercorarium DSM 8532]|jgi:uncharacterized XkdX family phage protein|uniref:Phage uncharacterized protein, XkdX family n=1 Tax=Thermoclostridium stercorarium (strain ATCC 35414 / DSM 8532 / NCIMB 11754) TaxID=1121335 RepID=L7VLR0_THES1|nr:XkdX family protein [Thermoclostridium stercorarium]AGC67451.1 phage uncharacterized protein, XkdX family [Thermoclostridium stercorarium subsp. stercorarium DSM 8532]AGI38511.1 phage protein [Thermoclostridium stercorarium subsp. stercorarium DSM 8532]
MNWFNIIKWFYEGKLWTKEQVADAVRCGKISNKEYKEVTGEEYIE